MARMLISLRKQQNVNFTQRKSSKMSILGQKRLNVDFMLTRDDRMLISLRKQQNVNYTQRISSKMLISGLKR